MKKQLKLNVNGQDYDVEVEANRLLSFLNWFRPAPADHVPTNSILREFISPPTLFDQWDWTKF